MPDILSAVTEGDRTWWPVPEAANDKDALAERLERVTYTDASVMLLATMLRQLAIMQRRIERLESEQ